jgi:hypothetical protein
LEANNEEEIPHVDDDTIEVGQATLAKISLTTVLTDMPKINIGKQKEILGIDKEIDKLAKAFVNDQLPKTLTLPRPFVYKKLLAQFTKPITEGKMTEIMNQFPSNIGEVAFSFQSTLQKVYAEVAHEVPVSEVATYLGPKNIRPTSDKDFDFWFHVYWPADRPLDMFRLMQQGAITPEQVESIKEFYPSIYNYMKVAILNAITERKIKEGDKFMNLPPRADRGLAIFKQMRVVDYGPNIHATKPDEPKAAGAPAPKIDKGLQTQAQRAGAV